jgi:hypothetical protein
VALSLENHLFALLDSLSRKPQIQDCHCVSISAESFETAFVGLTDFFPLLGRLSDSGLAVQLALASIPL